MPTQPRSNIATSTATTTHTATPNIADFSAQHRNPLHLVSCVIPSHDPATGEVFTPRSVTTRAIYRFLADVPGDLAITLVTATDHHVFDPIDPLVTAEALRARMVIDQTLAQTQPGFPRHWGEDNICAWTATQIHIDTAMHSVIADALVEIDQAQRTRDIRYKHYTGRWFAVGASRATKHPSYITAISMLNMFDYFTTTNS